ncbi:MAG TPA: esterase-like activity of phytase family protein, partial [Xanthobacteraceae bacterium]|nr:esterase-like activity of phytase family protein [Xanthobacteraceae bacterium]
MKAFAVAAVSLVVLASTALAQSPVSPRSSDAPQRIDIKAKTIDYFEPRDPSRRRFGALEFRGGLELTSSYKPFGGISGLRVYPDGAKFLALTDRSRWLEGRIVYQGETPVGIADARMAPMLGPDGRALTARGWYDTESMSEDAGNVYVGIERANKIVKYEFARHGLLARGQPIPVPSSVDALPYNRGLECIAMIPKGMLGAGTLLAIAERALDAAGNLKGILIGGPKPGEISILRGGEFDVSDCAVAPGGDLLMLERRFSWTSGVAIRLRRIALSTLMAGGVADGHVLFEADLGYQIDNMEALSVHAAKDGTQVVTMMSDDN